MTIEPYNYNDEPSGRSETLVQALDKIERLQKQLDVAVEGLDFFASVYDWNTPLTEDAVENVAEDYLKQIKDLEK